MAAEKITGFAGVPSTYSLLLSRGKVNEHDLSSLRYVLQAGGAMPVAVTEQVLAHISPHVYVMYGQTEATARLTWLPPAKLMEKLGSAGIPIDGVEIQIRNPEEGVCTPYEEGELFVRGDNVSIGYWANPEATAATFIDGWLKTGDLGYKDEDGYIFLKGRRSDMIKSGANRISPLEIEEVIVQMPGVEEVAVIGVPDELLGQTITAFLVMKPGHELDVRAVKKHCLDNLASYKIPKQIMSVDALPKTASGKVRKHILAEQVGGQS
jgi:acyl-CoA synthetase (AMP-forming)/AMP-acid ligase II